MGMAKWWWEKILKLEELSENMDAFVKKIPYLANGRNDHNVHMAQADETPKYPPYMRFAEHEETRNIIMEVYADDFQNFGYESLTATQNQ